MSMNISIKKILAVLTPLGAGLDSTILEEIEQNAGFRLPMDYREFLSTANGASGEIGGSGWLHLYPIEEVIAGIDAYHEFLSLYPNRK